MNAVYIMWGEMMFQIRYVGESDKNFWYTQDKHMDEKVFGLKIRDKQGYIICDDEKPIGIMRYNLFWDNTPFLNLIILDETYRNKGFGTQTMKCWEDEMSSSGYKLVMTSTQADEEAQFFYRKNGYKDSGCLILQNEPTEIILIKYL